MLLTRRLERPATHGFVASDYALSVWGSAISVPPSRVASRRSALFDEDMLGDDLEVWMADSYLLKRMFRNTARSGLIEKRHPGKERPAGRDRLDRPRL
jgi:ATP-dependent Lhr-like helicase